MKRINWIAVLILIFGLMSSRTSSALACDAAGEYVSFGLAEGRQKTLSPLMKWKYSISVPPLIVTLSKAADDKSLIVLIFIWLLGSGIFIIRLAQNERKTMVYSDLPTRKPHEPERLQKSPRDENRRQESPLGHHQSDQQKR